MPIRQQVLHHINITQLKGLSNLQMTFEPHKVTGVFGVNGSGKSSLIHALMAIYKPGDLDAGRRNFKLSQFFTPTTHSRWAGSQFTISHSFRQDGNLNLTTANRNYSKASDRWMPRHMNRPERDVYFVGLETCVPAIELERKESLIALTTQQLTDDVSNLIRTKAGYILNRDYQEYNKHLGGRKLYMGLRHNGIPYSSLSMGAGEQRLFKILEVVFKAPSHSLIVIDEIDLTLHTDALNRLINVLVHRANDKNLQIIFTSHREELVKRRDINIRHIVQTPGGSTMCFEGSNPDCISRLTGQQQRPVGIFVEDPLAAAIARKVAGELNIVRYCEVKTYGAAGNSFPLAMGLHLKGENMEDIGIFLDGDVYFSEAEKLNQAKKFYTGNEPAADARRALLVSYIRQFDLPNGSTPETFINTAISELNDDSEIVNMAQGIQGVLDKHEYIDRIVADLGYPEPEGISKVVEKLATTPEWISYTLPLRSWLEARKVAHNIA